MFFGLYFVFLIDSDLLKQKNERESNCLKGNRKHEVELLYKNTKIKVFKSTKETIVFKTNKIKDHGCLVQCSEGSAVDGAMRGAVPGVKVGSGVGALGVRACCFRYAA